MVRNGKKKKRKITLFDCFNIILMIFLSIIFLYPFWQTLVLSFSDDVYASSLGLKLWPPNIDFSAYEYVFKQKSIWIGYKNTIWRTVVGTVVGVLVTYCAGYTMARKDLAGRGFLTFFMVFTMFFGGGLIPTFLTMKSYGLLENRWVLIITSMTSAWNIMIARNYISGLPEELEEAAVMDGAHPLRIVFQIFFPLSMPIIAVLALWNAVGHWNSWFDAMIYLSGDKSVVLQTILRRILNELESIYNSLAATTSSVTMTPQAAKSATIIVAIVPIICVYPFLQKYFVKGVTVGAIKG